VPARARALPPVHVPVRVPLPTPVRVHASAAYVAAVDRYLASHLPVWAPLPAPVRVHASTSYDAAIDRYLAPPLPVRAPLPASVQVHASASYDAAVDHYLASPLPVPAPLPRRRQCTPQRHGTPPYSATMHRLCPCMRLSSRRWHYPLQWHGMPSSYASLQCHQSTSLTISAMGLAPTGGMGLATGGGIPERSGFT
jgi:hypothetical protein